MGLKGLRHLKDTLSKIKEKNAKISEHEDKLKQLVSKKSDEELNVDKLQLTIGKKNKRIKTLEKKASNVKAPLEIEEEKELTQIEVELGDFNRNFEKFREKEHGRKFIRQLILGFLFILYIGFFASEDFDARIAGKGNIYQCDNGKIIPGHWVNDGYDDCGDNSDEDVEVTEELSQVMEYSENRHFMVTCGYCCFIPVIFLYLSEGVSDKYEENVRLETQKENKLKVRKETLQNKKTTYNLTKSAPTRMKQEIEKAEKRLGGAKSRVNKFEDDIQQTKSEIARLKDEIDEHYESIKHLIPFSDKIDE